MNKVFYTELEFWLSHLRAIGLGARPFICVSLHFITCKMGLTHPPTSSGCGEDSMRDGVECSNFNIWAAKVGTVWSVPGSLVPNKVIPTSPDLPPASLPLTASCQ